MIRTKIIATLGPGSESPSSIAALIDAGVDVFRLNFSHGTIDTHAAVLGRIVEARRAANAPIAVLADLCGPKIRLGTIAGGGFDIRAGDRIALDADTAQGSPQRVGVNRPQLIQEVKSGHRILIDDGNVELRVDSASAAALQCVCVIGGRLSDRKGMNFPDSDLEVSALTPKDHADVKWITDHDVDYIALSFVRSAADISELRRLIPAGSAIQIVAKIETRHATQCLDEIIAAADAVMVARGDLAVEMDLATVPLIQKDIARRCRIAGKPVIVATQMLQSMVERPTPTRAEVSDVANAILDEADCVMLSAETAVGPYAVEAVRMMGRIAAKTEAFSGRPEDGASIRSPQTRPVTTAVGHGASVLCRELGVKLVAVWTQSGKTARLLSKHRVAATIVGLSADAAVCRRMAMYYGVEPMQICRNSHNDDMLKELDAALKSAGLAVAGDRIIVIAGTQLDDPGATNALLIHLVA